MKCRAYFGLSAQPTSASFRTSECFESTPKEGEFTGYSLAMQILSNTMLRGMDAMIILTGKLSAGLTTMAGCKTSSKTHDLATSRRMQLVLSLSSKSQHLRRPQRHLDVMMLTQTTPRVEDHGRCDFFSLNQNFGKYDLAQGYSWFYTCQANHNRLLGCLNWKILT